jgi:hypothetical protein
MKRETRGRSGTIYFGGGKTSLTVRRSPEFCRPSLGKFSMEMGVPYLKRLVAGFPPLQPRFRVRAACGVCGGQSGSGAGFRRVLRFPYESFHQFLYRNQPGMEQVGILMAALPSGPN